MGLVTSVLEDFLVYLFLKVSVFLMRCGSLSLKIKPEAKKYELNKVRVKFPIKSNGIAYPELPIMLMNLGYSFFIKYLLFV